LRLPIAVVLVLGCSPASPAEPAKASTVEGLGPAIEAAARGGPEALDAHFAWETLADRSTPPEIDWLRRSQFRQGMLAGLRGADGSAPFVQQLVGADYEYRGVAWRDGRPMARFRLTPLEGGFNFHDLVIELDEEGQPRIVDMHVLMSGEYLSETMRRVGSILLGGGSGLLSRGSQRNDTDDVQAMTQALQSGEPGEALRIYDSLSPRIRRTRIVQVIRLQAAAELGDERYLPVIDEVMRDWPDDVSLAAISLDAYVLREQWPRAIEAIAVLRRTYDDPFIDAMESRIQTSSGNPARGLELADAALAEEATLALAHDAALLAALALGQTERADRELRVLVDAHGVQAEYLRFEPGYEGITALPSYAPAP
jgi:hypothetical protein